MPPTAPASLKLFADARLVTPPRISVEVVGHGPDVVLIPGLNCSWAGAHATPTSTKAAIARLVTAPADADRITAWSLAGDRAIGGHATYDDVTLDLRLGLAAMAVPVTLVYPYDAKSVPFPLAAWDRLYQGQFAAIPHHTLTRIDDARHFIMCDQPAKFDAAIDTFLTP